MKRWFRRVVWVGLVTYLSLIVVFAAVQKSLIFPGHASQGQRSAMMPRNLGGELIRLKASLGDDIVAWFCEARDERNRGRTDAADRPTVIFFYGNGMSLVDTIGLLNAWQRQGANTLGVEYPGYGMSGGEPGERAMYAAADAAYDELVRRGTPPSRIIAAGLSLGTGVAVDLAARKTVGGVALFAPYTSMDAMARVAVPYVPTSLILRHHFRSDRKIGTLTCPILIARGKHDTIIPPIMSQRLAAAATRAAVTLVEVDSDHNDLFELAQTQLDAVMGRLIERVAKN